LSPWILKEDISKLDIEICKVLIDNKAHVNHGGLDFQWSPLNVAACNGNAEIVRLLIESNADFCQSLGFTNNFLQRFNIEQFNDVADLIQYLQEK